MLKPKMYATNGGDPVEAMQIVDTNLKEVAEWCGGYAQHDSVIDRTFINVPTPTRPMRADIHEWIVKIPSTGNLLILEQHIFNTYMNEIKENE